jgi:circadian clock protein KaiC
MNTIVTRNKDIMLSTQLLKCPTGIHGLDAITGGGLPRGRPTLVCGGAGSGKTLIGMEFLVRGIQEYNEHGVFVSFEERAVDLTQNVASLGFDLPRLIASKSFVIDHVTIDRREITETGEYNLDGLFIRLAATIEAVGAKRIVLDSIEALFAALQNAPVIRSELHRLFAWLKGKGITAVVTGERGEGTLTRHGLEEYVSDCVIVLDQPVTEHVATRRLRVAKYRGSAHGTNEYPFLIDVDGISVLPITSIDLNYPVTTEVVSSGIPRLDLMLGGSGYYRGGSLMVSGTAGAGKQHCRAFCRRGVPARRTVHLFCTGGIPRSDRTQHAFDRPGP